MSRGEVIGPGPDVAALVERINRGHARCLDGAAWRLRAPSTRGSPCSR